MSILPNTVVLEPDEIWTAAVVGARRYFHRLYDRKAVGVRDEPDGWQRAINRAGAEIAVSRMLGWRAPRFDKMGRRLETPEAFGLFLEIRLLDSGERLALLQEEDWKAHRPFVAVRPVDAIMFVSPGFSIGSDIRRRGEASHLRDIGPWCVWRCADSELRPLSELDAVVRGQKHLTKERA